MHTHWLMQLVVTTCLLTVVKDANAIEYSFIKIADENAPLIEGFPIGLPGVINESGEVAFVAFLANGERGLFVGAGGALTTIVNTNFTDFDSVIGLSINDEGTVSFRATRDNGTEGIFTGSGGATTTVIDDTSLFDNFITGYTSINNAGTVSFMATRDNTGVLGLYTIENGALTTIVDSGSAGDTDFASFSSPAMNAQGVVSFGGQLNNGELGLYTSNGSSTTKLLGEENGFTSLFGFTGINNAGAIVFRGGTMDIPTGIFVLSSGSVTPIADSAGPFGTFRVIGGINDAGTIVFSADLDNFSGGIYTGGDTEADKVIEDGDPLDGSTVADLTSSSTDRGVGMINSIGQIAFWAELADGRRGIFRADPDTDEDGVPDHEDACPFDANDDSDGDGVCDSDDACADSDDAIDADGDGVPDGCDECPDDANKAAPGACGCGNADTDANNNGTPDCNEEPGEGDGGNNDDEDGPIGQEMPTTEECCGGGMPAIMPFMLLGWCRARRRKRSRAI